MTVAKLLKKARIEAGMEQQELAKALGVVSAYVSRAEKGYSLFSDTLLVEACRILNEDPEVWYICAMIERTEDGPEEIKALWKLQYDAVTGAGRLPQ